MDMTDTELLEMRLQETMQQERALSEDQPEEPPYPGRGGLGGLGRTPQPLRGGQHQGHYTPSANGSAGPRRRPSPARTPPTTVPAASASAASMPTSTTKRSRTGLTPASAASDSTLGGGMGDAGTPASAVTAASWQDSPPYAAQSQQPEREHTPLGGGEGAEPSSIRSRGARDGSEAMVVRHPTMSASAEKAARVQSTARTFRKISYGQLIDLVRREEKKAFDAARRLHASKQQMKDLHRQIQTLQEELDRLRAMQGTSAEQSAHLDQLTLKVRELETAREAERAKNLTVVQEREASETRIQELTTHIEMVRREMEQQHSTFASAQQDAERELARLQDELSAKKKKQEEQEAIIDQYKGRIRDIDQERQQLYDELQRMRDEPPPPPPPPPATSPPTSTAVQTDASAPPIATTTQPTPQQQKPSYFGQAISTISWTMLLLLLYQLYIGLAPCESRDFYRRGS